MRFFCLSYLLNSLFISNYNKFDKNDIIDNIGQHKRIDRTWLVEEIVNGNGEFNHGYPIVVHDYVLRKLNSNANITSSQVKRSIRRGLVFINGRKATNQLTVRIGDIVQLVSQVSVAPFSGHNASVGRLQNDLRIRSVDVLFEDDHCAVVNKPQGMTIFPTPGSCGESADWSLQSALLVSLQPFNSTIVGGPDENEGNLIPLRRPQCVHRLDKGTGGLVVVAKSRPALTALTTFFSDRRVTKRYLALLKGRMILQDTFGLKLECRSSDREMIGVASFDVSGKQAVSEVRVLAHRPCPRFGWVTLVEVSPLTGRTHQIRKHMQSLGHSIVGDNRYGGNGGCLSKNSNYSEEINDNNPYENIMYLWAVYLSFPHPISGQKVEISLPEPLEIRRRFSQCN